MFESELTPANAEYQRRTERQIPVMVLEPEQAK
jgi:hypothetical protein